VHDRLAPGSPDAQERDLTVIWGAEVADGALATWRIVEDTPGSRARLGLSSDTG